MSAPNRGTLPAMEAGSGMRQGELFGAADLAQPVPPPPAWPAPIPENIRPKLERRLVELSWTVALVWPDWEVKAMTDHFTAMADRLGPEESAVWVGRWREEMARLEAAPPPWGSPPRPPAG